MAPPMTLAPGTSLGPYQIVSQLGAGGDELSAASALIHSHQFIGVLDPESEGLGPTHQNARITLGTP